MNKTLLALAVLMLAGPTLAGGMDINLGPGAGTDSKPADKPLIAHGTPAPAQAVTAVKGSSPLPAKTAAGPAMHPVVASAPVHVEMPHASLPLQQKAPAKTASKVAAKPAAKASTSMVKPTEAAPVAAEAAVASGVNPFTGNTVTSESLQRQLEHAKSETQLLEERLKQATLLADMANLPAKKKAELAQLKGPAGLPPGLTAGSDTKPAPKAVKKSRVRSRQTAEQKAAPVEVVHPSAPSIQLEGIVVNNGYASAVLNINGATSIVPNGGMTSQGTLQVMNEGQARVGGQLLQVHDNTMARVRISDPKPVDPKAQGLMSSGLPGKTSVPLSAGGKAPTLPPLPLPPIK